MRKKLPIQDLLRFIKMGDEGYCYFLEDGSYHCPEILDFAKILDALFVSLIAHKRRTKKPKFLIRVDGMPVISTTRGHPILALADRRRLRYPVFARHDGTQTTVCTICAT